MPVLFSNNAATTLSAGINSSATSIVVADGSLFPALSGSNYFYVTLEDAANSKREIVKVTARSGNTLTVTRGQDGTSGTAFSSADRAELRLNAAALNDATSSNDFTTSDHDKLDGIEASATGDQSSAEIRALVESASDSNVFTDSDHSKLNAIEASANVTDTANVVGALTAGSNIAIAADGTISSSTAELKLNSFTGDGSTTAFTLSSAVSENSTVAFIDGVYQNKTSYSISNNVLTFSAAPDSGAAIEISAVNIAPVQESTEFLINNFSGNGSTTAFTLSSSPVENQTAVFISGVYQSKATYAVSGTTLTFSTPPPVAGIEVMVAKTIVYSIGQPDDNTVSTVKIQDDAVTTDKLANNVVINTSGAITGAAGSFTTLSASAAASVTSLAVDNITIDGNEIDVSSGNLTLDVAGYIALNADNAGTVIFEDASLQYLVIESSSSDAVIKSGVQDGDIVFKGNDNGNTVTALTLDMSEAGEATFNADIKLGDGKVARFGADQDFRISFDGNNAVLQNVTSDSDITFLGKDGSSAITALTLDMSEAGAATFNSTVTAAKLVSTNGVLSGSPLLVGISSAVGIGGSPSDTNSAEVGSGYINLNRDDTASATQIQFSKNGSVAGSIVTTTSTAYNTSSDYRLKENVVPMSGSIDRLKTLKPSRFNFIVDADTTVDGFLAHEAQAVVPECVTGTKDAMKDEEYEVTAAVEEVRDEDDNITTEAADAVMGTRSVPDMQGIDQSKLVPLLVAALQEAVTKIEELTARITALEGE